MLLLDTCTLIWFAGGSDRLSAALRDRLARETIWVSELSLCEVVIKEQTRDMSFGIDFDRVVGRAGFGVAPVPAGMHAILARLPMIHRDPFDRMLIAHALFEKWTLVTSDNDIRAYDVPTYW